jgi:ribosome modulation factor
MPSEIFDNDDASVETIDLLDDFHSYSRGRNSVRIECGDDGHARRTIDPKSYDWSDLTVACVGHPPSKETNRAFRYGCDPYVEGFEAFFAGCVPEKNPYKGKSLREMWMLGFIEAREERHAERLVASVPGLG